jgi:hypothetical protein
MTCTIAVIAEKMHMATVRTNKLAVSAGGMNTGSADSAVTLTMTRPMAAAMQNPITALSNA